MAQQFGLHPAPSLVDRITIRLDDTPAVVLATGADRLYRDDDVPANEAEGLFVRAVAALDGLPLDPAAAKLRDYEVDAGELVVNNRVSKYVDDYSMETLTVAALKRARIEGAGLSPGQAFGTSSSMSTHAARHASG